MKEHKCWEDIEKCEKCRAIKEQTERDIKLAVLLFSQMNKILKKYEISF